RRVPPGGRAGRARGGAAIGAARLLRRRPGRGPRCRRRPALGEVGAGAQALAGPAGSEPERTPAGGALERRTDALGTRRTVRRPGRRRRGAATVRGPRGPHRRADVDVLGGAAAVPADGP